LHHQPVFPSHHPYFNGIFHYKPSISSIYRWGLLIDLNLRYQDPHLPHERYHQLSDPDRDSYDDLPGVGRFKAEMMVETMGISEGNIWN
jgi:hypothetical protein